MSATGIGVVDVVGDEDHPDAALACLGDIAQHDRCLMHAERRGRLIEDQHAGAVIDRAGDRHALPLAARQRADGLVRIAHGDADARELLETISSARRMSMRRVMKRPILRLAAEEEVPRDRHERDHRQILENGRDALVERLARRGQK